MDIQKAPLFMETKNIKNGINDYIDSISKFFLFALNLQVLLGKDIVSI